MQNPSKVLLRKNIKNILKSLNTETKQKQSLEAMKKLFNLPEYQNSNRISIYLSTDNEVATIPMLSTMFKQNKQLFVPTYSGNKMKMLKLYDMKDYEKLPMTKWNIKQPDPDDISRENPLLTEPLDLILLPGVAFTLKGDRLGHGMGYYDKYLNEYFKLYPNNEHHKTHLIGLAFREQIVDELPMESFDCRLDFVLTN